MKTSISRIFRMTVLLVMAYTIGAASPEMIAKHASQNQKFAIEKGKQLYLEGIRADGSLMTGMVRGDVPLTGRQVVCVNCHRISAMGSNEGANEGAQVVPSLRGEILFEPLRLPTSKPPQAPIQRAAYSQESLRRAIRDGINASGKSMSPTMPRYPLSDKEIDAIGSYLQSLTMTAASGVTDNEIHLATVVGKSTSPEIRKAMLDVFEAFMVQKNSESRHESKRAEHAPWHKAWIYESYRKWVLHVWELEGSASSWAEQLEHQYRQQPVFALIGGTAHGDWRPIHQFCQHRQLPCLFPSTSLPVVADQDFYSVYLDKGMSIQGEIVAEHLAGNRNQVIQVYAEADPLGRTAAASLRNRLEPGRKVLDLLIDSATDWPDIIAKNNGATVVLWLGQAELAGFWKTVSSVRKQPQIYLSTTLFGEEPVGIPEVIRDRVYFVHPYELPAKLPKTLLRATGWLRAKKIYDRDQEGIQADTYLALTLTGMALKRIRGYFIREYFIEGLEHILDNATFTSRYPRISLAPGQRFAAKGAYIVKPSGNGQEVLEPVTDWLIPDT
jgi:mono/diheme cytochrome c family protein